MIDTRPVRNQNSFDLRVFLVRRPPGDRGEFARHSVFTLQNRFFTRAYSICRWRPAIDIVRAYAVLLRHKSENARTIALRIDIHTCTTRVFDRKYEWLFFFPSDTTVGRRSESLISRLCRRVLMKWNRPMTGRKRFFFRCYHCYNLRRIIVRLVLVFCLHYPTGNAWRAIPSTWSTYYCLYTTVFPDRSSALLNCNLVIKFNAITGIVSDIFYQNSIRLQHP